ncbi:MAG: helix-turn-helix domain-containing protein [Ferrovum sp.]|nr:helix-turn-helix domain-containing protein [Ferrovum sp.]
MSPQFTLLSVSEAAKFLGISGRMMYTLAAPEGPIMCFRIGRRILFNQGDIQEYLRSCQYTETKQRVVSSLSSTAVSIGKESGLVKIFRKHGIEPKLTPSTGKKRQNSTPTPLELKDRNSQSRKLSLVT